MIRRPVEVLERVVAERRHELAERRQQAADLVTVRRAVQGIDLSAARYASGEQRRGGSAQS